MDNVYLKITFDGIHEKANCFERNDIFTIRNNVHNDTYIRLRYIASSKVNNSGDSLIFEYQEMFGSESSKYCGNCVDINIRQYMINDNVFWVYVRNDYSEKDLYIGQFRMLRITKVYGDAVEDLYGLNEPNKTDHISNTSNEPNQSIKPTQSVKTPTTPSTPQTTEPIRSTRTISTMQGECSMCPYLDNYNMYCNYHMCNISNNLYNAKCTNPELLERKNDQSH